MTKSIQQILDEQKQQSKIYEKDLRTINAAIGNYEVKDDPIVKANRREAASRLHSNKKTVAKRKDILTEIYKTDEWKHAQSEGAKRNAKENKEWLVKTIERNQRMANDPTRVAKIKESKVKLKEDAERYNEYLKGLSQRGSRKIITPLGTFASVNEAANAHGVAGNTLRRNARKNPDQYQFEEYKKPRKTTSKPIMTPSGPFESKTKAAIWALENGLINAEKKIDKWLKTDQTNFYYITQEEYIMLTGTDK